MGMNDESSREPVSPDDLAAYALDAQDAADASAIADQLQASPAVARREQDLRIAAGEWRPTLDLTSVLAAPGAEAS